MKTAIALLTLLACAAPAEAQMKEADIQLAIIEACHAQMAEFGVDAIHTCIASESEAVKAVLAMPPAHASFVQRCHRVGAGHSWWVVKACVERDVAAEQAILGYGPEHADRIAQCRARFAGSGSARVKQCVDAS